MRKVRLHFGMGWLSSSYDSSNCGNSLRGPHGSHDFHVIRVMADRVGGSSYENGTGNAGQDAAVPALEALQRIVKLMKLVLMLFLVMVALAAAGGFFVSPMTESTALVGLGCLFVIVARIVKALGSVRTARPLR